MPSNKEFAQEVEALALTVTGYQEGKSGQNGLCDCIGLIMGAMARLGRGSYPIHSTNYFARYQTDNLAPLIMSSQLRLGDIVYRATDDTADLNERYQPGGRYYTGDMMDYFHIGVVTGVSQLEITHCTSSGNISGIVRDNNIKNWDWRGMVRGVDYAPDAPVEEDSALQSIVISPDGNPVKLRQNPGTNKPYIAKVQPGTVVSLIESADGWAHIKLPNGTIGYMMTQFLAPLEVPEKPDESCEETHSDVSFEEMVLEKLDRLIEAVNAISGGAG